MLEWALAGRGIKNKEELIAFARSHTWENNVNEMCQTIESNVVSAVREKVFSEAL
jgi:hypothetical protein